MTRTRLAGLLTATAAATVVAGCGSTSHEAIPSSPSSAVTSSTATSSAAATHSTPAAAAATTATTIPAALAPFGNGYPTDGSPCRRLGESPQTSQWLDDSTILVGCPTSAAVQTLNGTVVGKVNGITIISIPLAKPSASAAPSAPAQGTHIACAATAAGPTSQCATEVTKNWGEDKTTLVKVTKPDGTTRSLFFHGTTPYGADSAESDGSAGFDFTVSRHGGNSVITFGPERYIVPDALVR